MSQQGGYGYVSDTSQVNNGVAALVFGLNAGKTRLTKCAFTPNGGKNNAPQEAFDIAFTVNSQEKSYRLFPVTKAYGKNNVEITNPQAPEMIEAYNNFNGIITHILKCFRTEADIQSIFSQAQAGGYMNTFQGFVSVVVSMLPANFADYPLDLFAQYQFQLTGENNKTYLEIPTKMKHGLWLCPAVPAYNEDGTIGEWMEVLKKDPKDNDENAIMYIDGKGNIHPFTRNGWFAQSNFAHQITEGAGSAAAGQAAIAGNPNVVAPAGWGAPAPSALPQATTAAPYQAPVIPTAQPQPVQAAPVQSQPAQQAFAAPAPPVAPQQPAPVAPAQQVQPQVNTNGVPPVAPAQQQTTPVVPQQGQAPW